MGYGLVCGLWLWCGLNRKIRLAQLWVALSWVVATKENGFSFSQNYTKTKQNRLLIIWFTFSRQKLDFVWFGLVFNQKTKPVCFGLVWKAKN